MKIEFLFRGLDCFGNWHLGSLITDNKTYWFIQTTLFKVSVDPESVGQYTNMIDKNGVKIFQGDIVIAYCAPSGSDRSKIKNRKCYIGYEDLKHGWSATIMDYKGENWATGYMSFGLNGNALEVIGTIHDVKQQILLEAAN